MPVSATTSYVKRHLWSKTSSLSVSLAPSLCLICLSLSFPVLRFVSHSLSLSLLHLSPFPPLLFSRSLCHSLSLSISSPHLFFSLSLLSNTISLSTYVFPCYIFISLSDIKYSLYPS